MHPMNFLPRRNMNGCASSLARFYEKDIFVLGDGTVDGGVRDSARYDA
jgi:hypothetical protein